MVYVVFGLDLVLFRVYCRENHCVFGRFKIAIRFTLLSFFIKFARFKIDKRLHLRVLLVQVAYMFEQVLGVRVFLGEVRIGTGTFVKLENRLFRFAVHEFLQVLVRIENEEVADLHLLGHAVLDDLIQTGGDIFDDGLGDE